jgi:hypothetical protein
MFCAVAVFVATAVVPLRSFADEGKCLIDLRRFTVDGIGLSASPEDVRRVFGGPDEVKSLSAPFKDERHERKKGLKKRKPLEDFDKIVYAYFKKGLAFTFAEEDLKLFRMEIFISETAPYSECMGKFAHAIPFPVRETQLLRPLSRQIYKDRKNELYLQKDEVRPVREMALLKFTAEGWLKKITFERQENLTIDLDNFCVGGVCLGGASKDALAEFGPPDGWKPRRGKIVVEWRREGLAVYVTKKDKKIERIVVDTKEFDGGFAGDLRLTARKETFHDYLGDRIYQEGLYRICAYKKGEPLSVQKAVVRFDEDERCADIVFGSFTNVKADLEKMSIAGLAIGDSPKAMRRRMGTFTKWREMKDSVAIGYPNYGVRLVLAMSGRDKRKRRNKKPRKPRWDELGAIRKIEVNVDDCWGLYAVPVSLAKTKDGFEREASGLLFGEKGDSLFFSKDGHAPKKGVIAKVNFEKIGWPKEIALREYRDLAVDMKKFTIAGIGIGTHLDELLKKLGPPPKVKELKDQPFTVLRYVDEGFFIAVDNRTRSVVKIRINMELFEGSFVQALTLDAGLDDYEKLLYKQMYRQTGRALWLSRDGKKPTWEEAVIQASYTGRVEDIVFQTLAMRKEGLLYEITKELE